MGRMTGSDARLVGRRQRVTAESDVHANRVPTPSTRIFGSMRTRRADVIMVPAGRFPQNESGASPVSAGVGVPSRETACWAFLGEQGLCNRPSGTLHFIISASSLFEMLRASKWSA
jgi:hypothetical protein